jgi:hypothetical protein
VQAQTQVPCQSRGNRREDHQSGDQKNGYRQSSQASHQLQRRTSRHSEEFAETSRENVSCRGTERPADSHDCQVRNRAPGLKVQRQGHRRDSHLDNHSVRR